MVAAAVPFAASMLPSERAKAAGAPVEVDIGDLAAGSLLTVEWRRQPVWILSRTPAMLAAIRQDDELVVDPNSRRSEQPSYAQNEYRSIRPQIAVLIGICTHLGCSPVFRPAAAGAAGVDSWSGGFYCPCHGSRFDLAGRVLKNSPAPTNLVVPPYRFLAQGHIVVGEDSST